MKYFLDRDRRNFKKISQKWVNHKKYNLNKWARKHDRVNPFDTWKRERKIKKQKKVKWPLFYNDYKMHKLLRINSHEE